VIAKLIAKNNAAATIHSNAETTRRLLDGNALVGAGG
jgi:hypothetical protein